MDSAPVRCPRSHCGGSPRSTLVGYLCVDCGQDFALRKPNLPKDSDEYWRGLARSTAHPSQLCSWGVRKTLEGVAPLFEAVASAKGLGVQEFPPECQRLWSWVDLGKMLITACQDLYEVALCPCGRGTNVVLMPAGARAISNPPRLIEATPERHKAAWLELVRAITSFPPDKPLARCYDIAFDCTLTDASVDARALVENAVWGLTARPYVVVRNGRIRAYRGV